MENKRGQFYLMGAIIIIAIIIGFANVTNYSERKTPIKIYDLSEELGIEGEMVLDYGTFNDENVIAEFTKDYAVYAEEDDQEIYFIFGNKEEIFVITYEEISQGTITIGGITMPIQDDGIFQKEIDPNGEDIILITIEGIEFEFELTAGENFYFIISQEIEGELHIVTNQDA